MAVDLPYLVLISAYLIITNTLAIAAFAFDKARAIAGGWRVPESDLLLLAVIGGSGGALWARQRFRHKTRKQPFASQLDFIAMLHAGLLAGLGIFWLTG